MTKKIIFIIIARLLLQFLIGESAVVSVYSFYGKEQKNLIFSVK